MVAAMLKQTRLKILLSLNAAAILLAGIIIAGAIWIPKESTLHVVSERSDETTEESDSDADLLDSVSDSVEKTEESTGSSKSSSSSSSSSSTSTASNWSSDPVPDGELWNETSITIYQTADQDICVSSALSNLGDMYWQTSNTDVIEAFYAEARTRLGYDSEHCRYPKIAGTGTTTITAGTYDGKRRDSITVTVIAVPVEQWKREVLTLVNKERTKEGLSKLSWSSTCESGAQIRATEIITKYDHTRPDGSSWETVCPIPKKGGTAGENVAAGNTSVSPETVVETWMASETHKANILNKNFTKMSVGFVFDPSSQYKTYWEQFFSTY